MLCPVCNVTLQIAERQNIEIDYCPQCRGVWLDRGELDKIIERANSADTPTRQYPENSPYPEKRKNDEPRTYGDRDRRVPFDERRRKKSFLDEIFDIFD